MAVSARNLKSKAYRLLNAAQMRRCAYSINSWYTGLSKASGQLPFAGFEPGALGRRDIVEIDIGPQAEVLEYDNDAWGGVILVWVRWRIC